MTRRTSGGERGPDRHRVGQITRWMGEGNDRTEAEVLLFACASLAASALIVLLRAADALIEVWPLPPGGASE